MPTSKNPSPDRSSHKQNENFKNKTQNIKDVAKSSSVPPIGDYNSQQTLKPGSNWNKVWINKIVSLDSKRRKPSGFAIKNQPLLKSKTAGAKALDKAFTTKFTKQLQQIDRKDPGFRDIYEKISNYDISNKLRLETIKITRKQIRQYLRLQFPSPIVDKIMKAFNFAQVSTMDEYVKTIEQFIKMSFKEKCRLGF